jgi:hypothetical protein
VSGVIVHWSQNKSIIFIVKHVFYYYDKMSEDKYYGRKMLKKNGVC